MSTPKNAAGTTLALLVPPLESCNSQNAELPDRNDRNDPKTGQNEPAQEHRCPYTKTLLAWDTNGGRFHAIAIPCKRWPCPVCGRRKAKELAERTIKAKPQRFITLTSAHHAEKSPREVFDDTRRKIGTLAQNLRRDGHDFEYLRVLEPHKSGYPHYHLICRCDYIEQKELSFQWCTLTDAFIVDIRRIRRNREITRYLLKYVTKCGKIPYTTRKISWSKNFFPTEPKKEPGDYAWIEAKIYTGQIETVTYWEAPHIRWERLSPAHWVGPSVFANTRESEDRY